jgi:hypothetical protein
MNETILKIMAIDETCDTGDRSILTYIDHFSNTFSPRDSRKSVWFGPINTLDLYLNEKFILQEKTMREIAKIPC